MTKWLADVKASYAKQISYQAGYAPASTTATTAPPIPPALWVFRRLSSRS